MKKLFIISLFVFSSVSYSQTLLETIDLPVGTFWNSAYGMDYQNSKYWISSSSSSTGKGIIYAVNSNGILVDTLDFDSPWLRASQGLDFDGTDFWYVERKISRCDLYKVTASGTVIDSIPIAELFGTTSIYLGGAAWDGSGLWISVYYPDASAALYKINVAARAIVDTIPVFGLQPQGIAVKGDTLFYVMNGFQGDDERVYAVDIATKDTLFSFHVPETPGIRQNPRGITWDGTYFWLLAEPVGASSGRQLFKYDLAGSGTPQIFVPVSEIYFPNTTVGRDTSAILQLFNNGSAPLSVDSIKITGDGFSFYPISFPINITPGNSENITLTFTPSDYEFYTGVVSVYSNDPVSPVIQIDLSGQGVFDGPKINLTANSYNFGNVWIGEDGIAVWTFEIFNMGDESLEISGMNFNLPEFTYSSPAIPFLIPSTDTTEITVNFYPTEAIGYEDTLKINSNDAINPGSFVTVNGTGIFDDYNYGYTFWNYQVPMNPNAGSYQEFRVEGLKPINDITGDGINEVIISTDNYLTMCLDGAASGSSFPIWTFNTYFNNSNAGSIGQSWDYGVQDAMQIADDLNGDGYNDVVIGTGGGNEHVYAIDGTNGEIIWEFGDDINWSLGDFEAIDVRRDFNGDNVKDVLAIADGNDAGTGYHSAYLFNGVNGDIIWQYYYPGPSLAFGKSIISVNDINGDNVPDAVIAYGNNGTTNQSVRALDGTNGTTLWTRDMVDWEPKELLELPLPGDSSDVIAAEYFSNIRRLNGRSGEEVWSYSLGGLSGVIQMALIKDLNGDMVPDILIASFAANGLNCLSGLDGTQIWAHPMDFQYGVVAVPDIDGDGAEDVVTGDQTGTYYCISGKEDSVIFSHNFPGDRINAVNVMPSIDGNFSFELLAGTREGKVICFSGGDVVIPVELSYFTANEASGKIYFRWSTGTETNNHGFEIQRLDIKNEEASWEIVGFVSGHGNTTSPQHYTFTDESVPSGKYHVRLKQIDLNGSFEYSDIIEIEVGSSPLEYVLNQNYPNPFNPTTTITYSLKANGLVSLKVFDILGNEVKNIVNEEQTAGVYKLEFDASSIASGIYFYTLRTGTFISTKKMILMK